MAYTAQILSVDFVNQTAKIRILNDEGKEVRRDIIQNDSISVPAGWQTFADRWLVDGIKARRDKFEASRLRNLADIETLEAAADSDGVTIISTPIPRPGG